MDLNAEYDYSIKLLIIGDSCVGKSNYIIRLIHDQFNKEYLASVGLELKRSEIIINNKKIQLQIWDTAGQVKYKAVTKSLFSKVQGFIAMFDLTKGESFENIKNTIKSIKNECGEHTPIILVGNKNDKNEREVSEHDIKSYISMEKLNYIETSSKTGENIKKSINIICNEIMEKNIFIRNASFSLDSSQLIEKKKRKCC